MNDQTNEGKNKTTLYCSFCGKSQHEVKKLIAGPSVFICDECVDLCNDIIVEESDIDADSIKSKKEKKKVRELLKNQIKQREKKVTMYIVKLRKHGPKQEKANKN